MDIVIIKWVINFSSLLSNQWYNTQWFSIYSDKPYLISPYAAYESCSHFLFCEEELGS